MQTTAILCHPQCRHPGAPAEFGPHPAVQQLLPAIDASRLLVSTSYEQHGFRPHPMMVKQAGSAVRIFMQR